MIRLLKTVLYPMDESYPEHVSLYSVEEVECLNTIVVISCADIEIPRIFAPAWYDWKMADDRKHKVHTKPVDHKLQELIMECAHASNLKIETVLEESETREVEIVCQKLPKHSARIRMLHIQVPLDLIGNYKLGMCITQAAEIADHTIMIFALGKNARPVQDGMNLPRENIRLYTRTLASIASIAKKGEFARLGILDLDMLQEYSCTIHQALAVIAGALNGLGFQKRLSSFEKKYPSLVLYDCIHKDSRRNYRFSIVQKMNERCTETHADGNILLAERVLYKFLKTGQIMDSLHIEAMKLSLAMGPVGIIVVIQTREGIVGCSGALFTDQDVATHIRTHTILAAQGRNGHVNPEVLNRQDYFLEVDVLYLKSHFKPAPPRNWKAAEFCRTMMETARIYPEDGQYDLYMLERHS